MPIGVFDSGLGGLTVAKRLLEKLPHESMVFVGDEIHIPYGERTPQQIKGLALGICEFLVGQDAKLIIMACNMSSATALSASRDIFPEIPIIGVIEAGVRALLNTAEKGPVGVLATTGTVKTGAYSSTVRRWIPNAEVYEQACPSFVPLVEEGKWNTPEAEAVAAEYVKPLIERGCRTLILGCTHYPYLSDTIRKVAGEDVLLIDPAEETVLEASNILREMGGLNPPRLEPVHTYYTSADTHRFAALGSNFLGKKIHDVERLAWGVDLRIRECQEKTEEETTKSAL
jgi:glutamate racemase